MAEASFTIIVNKKVTIIFADNQIEDKCLSNVADYQTCGIRDLNNFPKLATNQRVFMKGRTNVFVSLKLKQSDFLCACMEDCFLFYSKLYYLYYKIES